MRRFKVRHFFVIVLFFTLISTSFNFIPVSAETLIDENIESPSSAQTVSGNIQVSGWAVGKSGIQKVEVYVDGKLDGQATYGSSRTDIGPYFPSYTNSNQSGFNYTLNTRKFYNGQHKITVTAFGVDSSQSSKEVSITSQNVFTPIMGQAQSTKSQMIAYFLNNNSTKGYDYINNFVSILLEEAAVEGVRADVSFPQMMKETNFLKFTGGVREWQNNFAGLGATGTVPTDPNVPYGETFPDIRTGIRACIQHLKGYASTQPLVGACVDNRYKWVTKGCAPYVEWLGIKENPQGLGWATDANYGYDIVNRMNYIMSIKIVAGQAQNASISASGNYFIGNAYTISASGTSSNRVLYKFWLYDYSNNTYTMLQEYSENSKCSWTPSKAGKYKVEVHIKDIYSNKIFDSNAFTDVAVNTSAVGTASNASISTGTNYIAGKSYTIGASGTSTNKVLYKFWLYDYTANTYSLLQDYSENSNCTWTPTKPGKYKIEVHIKDTFSSKVFDSNAYNDVAVNSAKASNANINVASNYVIGNSYTIGASGTSDNKVLYKFWLYDYSKGTYSMLQEYSENSKCTWAPSKEGKYRVEVHIRDSYSDKMFDSNAFADTTVATVPIGVASNASISTANNYTVGKSNTIGASATSTTKALYRFWLYDYTSNTYNMLQDYSENSKCSWTPSKAGKYRLEVHVKDTYSSKVFDSNALTDITVNAAQASNANISVASSYLIGNSYTIAASGLSYNKVLYKFWLYDYTANTYNLLQDYSENSKCTWLPSKAGKYKLEVHVKDIYSEKVFDSNAYSDTIVVSNGIYGKTIVVDAGHNYGGDDGANATYGGVTYYERYLNMFMALKLRDELQKLGATVIFTREASDASKDDLDTSLKKRVDIANNAKADLFISLHHDSNEDKSVTGISVHYSTYKPGLDNSGIVKGEDPNGGYHGVDIDTTPCKEAIIGRDLANRLADGLSSSLGYKNRKAHDHNLFVTKNTNMPAVLIECGFLSNQAEVERCNDPNQQTLKAQAIAKIVNDYYLTID